MPEKKTALVVGVGPGLGWALAKRFAREGMQVAVAARNEATLAELVASQPKSTIRAYGADTGERAAVERLFERVETELGSPDLVVFNASSFARGSILDLDPAEVERAWRIGCFGGLLVGQQAARRMVRRGAGTILFTGATASVRGSANFAPFAMNKFGLRALAQSMARELGPKGIHVAHVVIDGQIASERYRAAAAERGPDALLEPDAIAEAYWQLHRQPKTAWAFELDLRPWVEKF
ncbi:MAG: SDR family NAD(P)-dependent oxidoreductase [Proteobacteria bacterium]|nr:SDR family NAD(P)-dependent oxidoreductase [Pseudomonadota bacterium]MBI3499490.1 SDR family NAD(P)-dependent oxidoreductase [Pseudomonadota bacterium]